MGEQKSTAFEYVPWPGIAFFDTFIHEIEKNIFIYTVSVPLTGSNNWVK
jgi:hypothetical protein